MHKIKIENGYYLFKLEDLLKQKNISINKLVKDTDTDFKVIKRILTGDLGRIDIFVLARICNFLECSLNDIIEYIPNNQQ